jgi:hypothetical protein
MNMNFIQGVLFQVLSDEPESEHKGVKEKIPPRDSLLTQEIIEENQELFSNVISNWASQISDGTPPVFDYDDATQELWLCVWTAFRYWKPKQATVEVALKLFCRQAAYQIVEKHGGAIDGFVKGISTVQSEGLASHQHRGWWAR